MTFKQKFDTCLFWHEKVKIIALYHMIKTFRYKRTWTVRKTANYFGVSMGFASENLMLNEHMDAIALCKSRKQALIQARQIIRIKKK